MPNTSFCDFKRHFLNFEILSKVSKIFKEMDGLVSKSGKMLSTFEFWLELNTRCKGKTLLGIVNKLFVFSAI